MTDPDESEHCLNVDGMVDDGGGRGKLFNADEYTGVAGAGADGLRGPRSSRSAQSSGTPGPPCSASSAMLSSRSAVSAGRSICFRWALYLLSLLY